MCKKIVNSYLGLNLDLEHFNHIGEVNEANTAEPGLNLSAQLHWDRHWECHH